MGLNLGGGNKNLVEGVHWGGFFHMGIWEEMMRFLKHAVQKPTQVNLPHLPNG